MAKWFYIVAGVLATSPAHAEPQIPCIDTRAAAIESLEERYGETSVGRGIANSGVMMEILKSSRNGTWTLLVSIPGGRSCIVGAGHNWQELEEAQHGTDS